MPEIKLCKDCKYSKFSFFWMGYVCKKTLGEQDCIGVKYVPCSIERKKEYELVSCGSKAKYFERKPTLLERVKGWLS